MASRSCLVTVTDVRGIRQSVEVQATSVFDAAALALAALRAQPWTDPIGPATRLEIQVTPPAVTHTVTVRQLSRWASGAAISPEERLRKDRVKALLSAQTRAGGGDKL